MANPQQNEKSENLAGNENEDRRTRLKSLIVLGKERGYLTYAEINDHLPDDIQDSEQIDGIIGMMENTRTSSATSTSLLELGCGLGVPGMILHLLGCDVVLTDQEDILSQLEKNVSSNFHHTTRSNSSRRVSAEMSSSARMSPIAAAACVATIGSASSSSFASSGTAAMASSPISPRARAACHRTREELSAAAFTRSS